MRALVAVSLVLLLAPAAQAASPKISTIVVAGDVAPDTGGDTYLAFRPRAHIDGSGDIVFSSFLTGGGRRVDRWSAGGLTAIASTGDPVPGLAANWGTVEATGQNAEGDVALVGSPVGALGLAAVHVERSGAGTLLAQARDVPIPGSAGYDGAGLVSRPYAAEGAMTTFLYPSYLQGVFVTRAGTDTTVAVEGTQGPGGTYGFVGSADMSPSGDVVFVDSQIHAATGLYLFQSGVVTRVLAPGDTAPDTGGRTFVSFGRPSMTSTGRIVFWAGLDAFPGDRGIFVHDSGLGSLIALEGGAAPGGGTFADLGSAFGPLMNESGEILFGAILADGREGIFLVDSEGSSRVVITGQPAPGTGDGTFGDIEGFGFNEDRQIVFVADVDDGTTAFGVFRARVPHTNLPAVSGPGRVVAAVMLALSASLFLLRQRSDVPVRSGAS
jgi:hypothetical protein